MPGKIGSRLPKNRPPTSPGDMLKHEFLEPLNMTQREYAKQYGLSPKVINEICQGKRSVTPKTSIVFGEVLKMSPGFFFKLQNDLDLWHEIQKFKKKKAS